MPLKLVVFFDRYRKCKKSSNRASKINNFGRGPPGILKVIAIYNIYSSSNFLTLKYE
jgi:hypothetical protein